MAALTGMCRRTGAPLTGIEHLKQSIGDIVSTPLGSRRERPDYGSLLPRMVDRPLTAGWIAAAQAEVTRNIERWEARLTSPRTTVLAVLDGRVTMKIAGNYEGESVVLEITA